MVQLAEDSVQNHVLRKRRNADIPEEDSEEEPPEMPRTLSTDEESDESGEGAFVQIRPRLRLWRLGCIERSCTSRRSAEGAALPPRRKAGAGPQRKAGVIQATSP